MLGAVIVVEMSLPRKIKLANLAGFLCVGELRLKVEVPDL